MAAAADGAYPWCKCDLERGVGVLLAGGIDIARGPEDTAIYLTFGNAWGF